MTTVQTDPVDTQQAGASSGRMHADVHPPYTWKIAVVEKLAAQGIPVPNSLAEVPECTYCCPAGQTPFSILTAMERLGVQVSLKSEALTRRLGNQQSIQRPVNLTLDHEEFHAQMAVLANKKDTEQRQIFREQGSQMANTVQTLDYLLEQLIRLQMKGGTLAQLQTFLYRFLQPTPMHKTPGSQEIPIALRCDDCFDNPRHRDNHQFDHLLGIMVVVDRKHGVTVRECHHNTHAAFLRSLCIPIPL